MSNVAIIDFILAFILKHEDSHPVSGEVTCDLGGGVTKFGISTRYNPGVDVANLTKLEAEGIYQKKYILPFHLDHLQDFRVAAKIGDCLVNPGLGFAKVVQGIAGVPKDGAIGPVTIGTINLMDQGALLARLCQAQADYYYEHDADNQHLLNALLVRAADRPEV